MRRKILIFSILIVLSVLLMTACSNVNTDNNSSQSVTETTPIDVDSVIQTAVDDYMKITVLNDVETLESLPKSMWEMLPHTKDEYKKYMQSNVPSDIPTDLKWEITSIENLYQNVFEITVSYNDNEQVLTITKETDVIIDELLDYFNSMSVNMVEG